MFFVASRVEPFRGASEGLVVTMWWLCCGGMSRSRVSIFFQVPRQGGQARREVRARGESERELERREEIETRGVGGRHSNQAWRVAFFCPSVLFGKRLPAELLLLREEGKNRVPK